MLFYETIRVRVRNPYLPVDVSTRLPLHLHSIIGIQCRYCYGIERIVPRITADVIPRIGWFTLAVNNRKRPLGVFDVRYEAPWMDANDDYQHIAISIQRGAMLTGTYVNELQYPFGTAPAPTQATPPSGTGVTVGGTGGDFGDLIQWDGNSGREVGLGTDYDGLFRDSVKVLPADVQPVNPNTAANYDGYIVAIYLKCLGDPSILMR